MTRRHPPPLPHPLRRLPPARTRHQHQTPRRRQRPVKRLRRRHRGFPPLPTAVQNPALRLRPQHFRLPLLRLEPQPRSREFHFIDSCLRTRNHPPRRFSHQSHLAHPVRRKNSTTATVRIGPSEIRPFPANDRNKEAPISKNMSDFAVTTRTVGQVGNLRPIGNRPSAGPGILLTVADVPVSRPPPISALLALV